MPGAAARAEAAAALMAPMAAVVAPEHPAIKACRPPEAARRRRGFDHGEELAAAVACRLELDVAPLLARPRSRDQRALARRDRLANMEGRFIPLPSASAPPSVIVVDDVYTTGATLARPSDAVRCCRRPNCPARLHHFARVW